MKLAFCVFAKQLHVAWDDGDVILPLENNRIETVLFDILSVILGRSDEGAPDRGSINCISNEIFTTKMERSRNITRNGSSIWSAFVAPAEDDKCNSIIIPAGPAPFTQLRILRATQLGLATGLGCPAPMVNMFDVLFTTAHLKTGSCLLETRRGDYFFQTRLDGKIVDEGVSTDVILGKVRQHRDRGPIACHIPGSSRANPKHHDLNIINGSSVCGASRLAEDDASIYSTIISDDPTLSTVKISQNLAKTMQENDFAFCADLIYGIPLPY